MTTHAGPAPAADISGGRHRHRTDLMEPTVNSNPTPDPTHGLTVQQADALWDAVAIPGPQEPTFPVQHERVCRAVAGILDELAPATPSVSAVDQTTRDRIAAALYAHDHPGHLVPLNETGMGPAYREEADAVLAVLPPPADRAVVLRDTADRYEEILARANTGQDPRYWTAVRDVTLGLRGMADEAQQPAVGARQHDTETQAHSPQHAWRVETRDPLANQWAPGSHFAHRPAALERWETANRNAPLWRDGTPVERRIVRETTTYTVEVEHQPAAASAVPGRSAATSTDEEQARG